MKYLDEDTGRIGRLPLGETLMILGTALAGVVFWAAVAYGTYRFAGSLLA
jgi:hypothetical protein